MLSDESGIKIVKYILAHGRCTQSEIASAIGGSVGYVNKIVSYLKEQFIVSVGTRGLSLIDPSRLVILTANETPLQSRLFKKYLMPGYRLDIEERLAKELAPWNYAFTLLSALSQYSAALSSPSGEVSIYVQKEHLDKAIERLEELDIKESEIGNVGIYIGDSGILREIMLDGSTLSRRYVSKEQLIIDLYSYPPLVYLGNELLTRHCEKMIKETIIDYSKKEVYEFVTWFNKLIGHYPIIIGGWAVYYYNNYFGSKDIDVIFEAKDFTQQLLPYFKAKGYKEYTRDELGFTTTFRKEIKAGGATDFIDIDPCYIERKNQFHKDAGKEIPYSFIKKYHSTAEEITPDGSKVFFRIPSKELLLLYKIKAYLDRNFDSQHAISQNTIAYLISKRDKDGADIIALLDSKPDYEKTIKLIEENNIREEVNETLEMVSKNSASMNLYAKGKGKNDGIVKGIIREALERIKKQ